MVPSHQKALIFHQFFMFFPTPLPEVIFRGTLRRSKPKNAIFYGLWIPAGSQNNPSERNFRPKGCQSGTPEIYRTRPGTDLGAIWRRKRSKDAFSLILVPFLIEFLRDFGQCWKDVPLFCIIATPFFYQDSSIIFFNTRVSFIDFELIQVQLWTRYV